MKTKNMTTLHLRKSIGRSSLRLGFLLTFALACFALLPIVRAVTPPPDGGYPGENTAEGDNALSSLTTGVANTACGSGALFEDQTGSDNTAIGAGALRSVGPLSGRSGSCNTATGAFTLSVNVLGEGNTANGCEALTNNQGNYNTAVGYQALSGLSTENPPGGNNSANGAFALTNNDAGSNNTANGYNALYSNRDGSNNTSNGANALYGNTVGTKNTASGLSALFNNTTGSNNTAEGSQALSNNTTGSSNIALGNNAGLNLTTGNSNIEIGNVGVAGEGNAIRIGTKPKPKNKFIDGINEVTVPGGVGVIIDASGHLGTATSSARFKDEIRPMDKASEAIFALKPMTFHYKHELDPDGIPQFGLVAEQAAKVNPDLVARDHEGKPYTVRYEAVNAMLLNEFLKEHRTVQELKAIVAKQEATIAQQQKDFRATAAQEQKEIKALTARLKDQASQIQKVSARLEVSKPAPQTVLNNQ